MKNIHLILILTAVALGFNLRAQAPPPAPGVPAVPDAEAVAREKAAADAKAALTNTGRALPRPVVAPPTPGVTTLPSAATRPAAAPPVPGAPAAAGANTNRTGIRFQPLTPPPAPAAPVAPATGARTAVGPATTNVTAEAIRAAAAASMNAANAAAAAAAAAAGADPNAPAGAAAAPAVQPEEVFPPGLLKFSEADISPILEIYQELTGRTVLKSPTLPAAKITFKTQTPLTRSEAIGALETVLSMNQITMVPQGTKFVKAVPQAQAFQEAKQFDDLPWELYPESATMVTHVVQLKNALPNDLLPVLQPFAKMPQSILTVPSTSMLIIRDYAENAKRMLEIIEKIDVTMPQDFVDVVIPIKYALAGDIQQVLGSLTAGGGGGGTTVGRQQSNTGLSSGGGLGGGGGNRGGIGGGFGGGGLNGQPGNPYGAQGLGGATQGGLGGAGGAANRGSFAQRLNSIVSRAASGSSGDIYVLGQTKIIADERTNSLLIFASKQDLATISNIIEKLDVVLAQVLIEAVIMEVNLNSDLNFGMSYVQKNPTTFGDVALGAGAIRNIPFLGLNNVLGGGTASNSLGQGFTYAASFMNFDAAVTAIASKGRGKILQRPRIQTSHAVEANLFVGQSRPYPSSSSSGGIYGGYNQIQQLQIGVTLSVLPLINHDGLVVMDIRQKVESYDGDVIIESVGAVPITSQKEANAKVAVRDRETVMLGGFISNQKSKARGGVPILMDIPYLGALFRSNKDSEDRRELLVLIRPTVLPTPDIAATFAKEERARMPGTKEAEQDFTESERKLLEETDKRMDKKNDVYKREGFSK